MEAHQAALARFQNMLLSARGTTTLFANDFQDQMTQESCDTLQNMHALIEGYRRCYQDVKYEGSKALLLFGLLQGLFVAIDCLYTIGRATSLNKMMISINQNRTLRDIKHIRNDVVGHPSYRYYYDNVIGFCELELSNLQGDELVYETSIYEHQEIKKTKYHIKMLEVIEQYYEESTDVLEQTMLFLTMKKDKINLNVSEVVARLAEEWMQGYHNEARLNQIEDTLVEGLHLAKDSHHRVLWRIRLIRFLFNQAFNPYIDYLTILEMYKLYSLLFHFEKQIDATRKFRFVKFIPNPEFVLLKNGIKKLKKRQFDPSYLHDNTHPLFRRNFQQLLSQMGGDVRTQSLRTWIQDQLTINDRNMMYLIGSELKLK